MLIKTKRDFYRDQRHAAEATSDAPATSTSPRRAGLEYFIHRPPRPRRSSWPPPVWAASGRWWRVAPGAAHETKRWPVAHWQRLVGRLVNHYDVVVVGGPGEVALADDVAAAGGERAASAAGRFDPRQRRASESRCTVSEYDTGLMHSTAVGTPVALFGPTVRKFGFTPYRARATILERDLPCRPCSAHGGPSCPIGTHACLTEIEPDLVFESVRRLPR
ncbi:MAG: glycosyltransferase family 9 protein [Gemmatimonadales bacterium]